MPFSWTAATAGTPRAVLLIVAVLLVQALGLAVLAGWYIYDLIVAEPLSRGGAVFMAVLLLLLAGWMSVLGSALLRGYRWPRSAVLVFQLLMVILSISYFSNGALAGGLVMLLPGAVVLVALFTKPVVDHATRPARDSR